MATEFGKTSGGGGAPLTQDQINYLVTGLQQFGEQRDPEQVRDLCQNIIRTGKVPGHDDAGMFIAGWLYQAGLVKVGAAAGGAGGQQPTSR